jgi:hypothetical protein
MESIGRRASVASGTFLHRAVKTESQDPDFYSRRGSAQSAASPIGFKGAAGKGENGRLFESYVTEDADAIVDRNRGVTENAGFVSGTVQNALHDGSALGGADRPSSVKGRAEV